MTLLIFFSSHEVLNAARAKWNQRDATAGLNREIPSPHEECRFLVPGMRGETRQQQSPPPVGMNMILRFRLGRMGIMSHENV